ncbi:MAG TPA: LysR family transcriptional regulator [Polyangiaceae bacterium]|jgi:DNA-binding transcriptional LysR family regulator|nr:LysR family transcriptional regulator [Polyangiaceae bacterium]
MDYNDIPLFVRVVEAHSFTAAAEALGREKSSVSRAIARLEGDLGVRLLQRTTRKLALTEAGQAFYERVRTSVTGVDEAASAVRELGSEPRGVIRATAPPDSHIFGLGEALAQFVERYPQIHIDLSLSSRAVDLVAEGFDLAVRAGRLTDSSLVARRVGSTDLALFASPRYLAARGRPKTLADLASHDMLFFRTRGQATWTLTGPDGHPVTIELHGKLTGDDMSFLTRAAAGGAGIALIPAIHARGPAERGELELVLKDYRLEGGSLHVVLPSSSYIPSRVALLRDFLVEHLGRVLKASQEGCAAALGVRPRARAKAAAT